MHSFVCHYESVLFIFRLIVALIYHILFTVYVAFCDLILANCDIPVLAAAKNQTISACCHCRINTRFPEWEASFVLTGKCEKPPEKAKKVGQKRPQTFLTHK